MTTQQKIKACLDLSGMTITDLAVKMGTSQQNLSKRLKVGKFTQEELEKMAALMGCEYKSSFVFSDGNIIV